MNLYKKILEKFEFPLFFAPMEEVSDRSYRLICKSLGADILISEFVSSEALIRDVEKSIQKLAFSEKERPFGIQIFGHDEQSLIKAAQIAEQQNPDFIDINWGCPVKKVVVKGAGSAILKDIPKMVILTKAVVNAVHLPVTVKTRLGWDLLDQPIHDATLKLQDIGIQGITIHGRTRSQMYSGEADWTLIGEIKNDPSIFIPVIGNGDINSADKAFEYQKKYGVDGIMIGRAAIGNPWIFKEIKQKIKNEHFTPPTLSERIEMVLEHLHSAIDIKGERTAILEMRKHYPGYFKGISHFKETKIKLMNALTFQECQDALAQQVFESPDC
jgi:tRNA-dihydrouridine synthase B